MPHAGWMYSGRLAAAVLRRVQIPQRVIVFCPRHHGVGPTWAVAPCTRWLIPGGAVEGDPDLARTGRGGDGPASRRPPARAGTCHRGSVADLARLAPQARVVGITVGDAELSSLCRFGEQLAGVLRTLPERPLLLISSDMNHFADEARTCRLDRMALDAMRGSTRRGCTRRCGGTASACAA